MRKEANLEHWRELYDVAIRIKELKPWEHLWDIDIITIILPYTKEPYYCSIMGRNGECFAIGVYLGIKAIHNFYKIIDNKDIPPKQLIRYQDKDVIMCYFGDREELNKKELQIIKDLELKFRGRNNWIHFLSFNKGYAPYMLDEEEVLLETEILQHLFMALLAHIKRGLEVDFESGNTLLRRYDEEKELWLNYEAPLLIPQIQYDVPVLKDDLLMTRLSKQKITKEDIEIDIAYLNAVVNDKKYDRPAISRMCILADSRSGLIIDQSMLSPEDDDIHAILSITINFIMQRGKPKTIFVRDEYIESILTDICKRANIKIKIKGRLGAIDTVVEAFDNIRF